MAVWRSVVVASVTTFCRSVLLVRSLLALMPCCLLGCEGVRVGRGAALDPVVDKCRCRPGEITWWFVMIAHGGELAPAACHSSVAALLAVLVWW
jgi:hypothetical protein